MKKRRLSAELNWIKRLQTPYPLGLNAQIYQQGNISSVRSNINVFSLKPDVCRKRRSHGVRRNGLSRRKQRLNRSLDDLLRIENNNGRHELLHALCSIPVSRLKPILDEADRRSLLPSRIDFTKCRDIVEDALQTYCKLWSKKEGVGVHALNDWKNEFFRIIDVRIDNFSKQSHLYKQPSSRSVKSLKKKMEKLHRKYVFAPAAKAANNVIII